MRTVEDYLSDKIIIKETVDRLLSMKAAEMSQDKSAGNYLNCLIDESKNASLVHREAFDKELAKDLTFIELLALVMVSQNNPKYRFLYVDSNNIGDSHENYLYYVSKLLSFLLKGTDKVIDTFRRLKVKDVYLSEAVCTAARRDYECRTYYNRLCERYESYVKNNRFDDNPNILKCIDDRSTVNDFLRSCYIMAHISWSPGIGDPEKYLEGIKSAYELAGVFLVEHLTRIFRHRYDLMNMKIKYRREEL